MYRVGLQKGDEAYVSVRINKELVLDCVVSTISQVECAAEVYHDPEIDFIAAHEAVKACLNAIDFLLEKPRLREMLRERIKQLKEEVAREDEEIPTSPADGDLPF